MPGLKQSNQSIIHSSNAGLLIFTACFLDARRTTGIERKCGLPRLIGSDALGDMGKLRHSDRSYRTFFRSDQKLDVTINDEINSMSCFGVRGGAPARLQRSIR
jgi:hypothetical protein